MSQPNADFFESQRRTSSRVLPLIEEAGNRKQVIDWVAEHDTFEYVPFEGDLIETAFDICILDEGAFREHRSALARVKETAAPVIVPYVLLLPGFGETRIEFDGRELVDGITPASVDDIVSLPLKQLELEWRMQALLRLRNQSIQSNRTSRRYESLFESIRDAILVADTDRRIVDCNQAFTDLFGYSCADIAGESTHTVYESKTEFEKMGEAILGHVGDPEFIQTVSYETTSGTVFPGETNVFYLRDEDGEIRGFIGLIRDVSERVERERELERYEAAFEGSTDMLVAVDRDRRVLFANDRFRSLFGTSDESVRGVHLREMLSEAEFTGIETRFERALDGEAGQFHYELDAETDDPRTLDVHYYPLREDADATITGVVASIRDITDSEARKRQLRGFKQAVDAAGQAIYMTDPGGTITYANEAFEEITGHSPQEAIGENPRILKSGEMPEDYYEELWETVTSGEIWVEEVINRRKNGELYHAYQTIAPVTTDAGAIEGYVAIQTDVTAQKERQDHLLSIDRMLRHNLNNELNVVLGRAAMIEEAGDPDVAADARAIREASNRLLEQAAKEREIVKILVEPLQERTFDLPNCVRSVTGRVQEKAPEATIELDLPAGLEIRSAPHLERALEELLDNAIAHTGDSQPTVQITVTEREEDVAIEIVDDNPPIPQEELAVLSRVGQIDALTHTSGMGLWLVKRIVNRSDGSVTFDTREPRGNRITLVLPIG
ncbi:MAG: PAS domain S-box protein [Halodesulfurarchaeum sp.]